MFKMVVRKQKNMIYLKRGEKNEQYKGWKSC